MHTLLFSHMKPIFKQQRGSAIGNQISPSLANIAVSHLEHEWFQSQKDALKMHAQELYIVRFVDNRLVLCGQHLTEKWFMQEFLADFYKHPVELEDVTKSFLAPFWMLTWEHSHFNNQQLLFSFVLSDLQALKHTT